MENFGQAMPVSAVPLLTALLQRQQVYACFIDFQKTYDHVLYNSMFHKLSTKIQWLFLITPDSEYILEIVMCSKKKQSSYEAFHLHKKNNIRDAHAI